MLISIKKISDANHIVIMCDNSSFANANAIYSYVLTQHKKVSIYSAQAINKNLSFLPWFGKIRNTIPSSSDLSIEAFRDTKALFEFFKENGVKINKKMATSMYAGLLQNCEPLSANCDGFVFAMANELIVLEADCKLVTEFLHNRVPLCLFRLKAIIFKSIFLKNEATIAELFICDEDLKASGATLDEACQIAKEVLTLVNVKEVALYKSDEDNKLLKLIKEI